MKYTISVSTIVITALLFQVCMSNVESYHLKCPSQANWKIRARVTCNSTLKYFCLYNNVKKSDVEGCEGPDWDRKGSKRIFSGSFTRGNCSQNRYQPFKFKTHESMSDCIYAKSICSEEGQIVYQADSTRQDRTCQCDYTKNYTFIKTPKNICYCNPSEEDCTCYVRSCRVNYTTSTDYVCTQSNYHKNQSGIENNRHYETVEVKQRVEIKTSLLMNTRFKLESRYTTASFFVLIWLILVFVTGGFPVGLLFCKSARELHQFEECVLETKPGTLQRDDINFLRLIHLLFRVACPVVRTIFNHEIPPKQLRKTLDDNRFKMETLYRKNERIINDDQWGLLYNPVKGGTVKSEEFDIRLTIYLMCTLAKFKINRVYPDPSDLSDSAMLSRIKYIRNKACRVFGAEISEDKLKQYWNDIRQAVQTLCKLEIENDKENTQIIENLKEKSLLIPEGHNLHNRDNKFIDLTPEENNFLVVFFVLSRMVYPVVKNEFDIKCTNYSHKQFQKDEPSTKMEDINLTKENQQHYSSKIEESRNLDLRWMIFILNIKALEEGKTDLSEQLNVINDIQRGIVQSSSGMLNDERCQNILDRTKKAVLHLGGKWSEEQIVRLQRIKIF